MAGGPSQVGGREGPVLPTLKPCHVAEDDRALRIPCEDCGKDGWAVTMCYRLFLISQLGPRGVRGTAVDGT